MEASTPAQDPAKKSNKIVGIIIGSILVVVALGLIVFFVTRESEEDKALQAVCGARADIQTRVNDLASTTVTNFTISGFTDNLKGISNDVSTISKNSEKLNPNRKQELQQANQAFGDAVTSTVKNLGTNLSIDSAKEKLQTAGQELVDSYKQTLQPVDCSGVDISN